MDGVQPLLRYLANFDELIYEGMVVGYLLQPRFIQDITAAVTDIGDGRETFRANRCNKCRPHASQMVL